MKKLIIIVFLLVAVVLVSGATNLKVRAAEKVEDLTEIEKTEIEKTEKEKKEKSKALFYKTFGDSNTMLYFTSTISQTIAAMMGVLGAFTLYRLSVLTTEIAKNHENFAFLNEWRALGDSTGAWKDSKYKELENDYEYIQNYSNITAPL